MRYRSVKNVIDEIHYLKEKFSLNELLIIDDNFTINQKRAEKICNEIIKNRYDILINFSNGLRADTLTPKLIQKLKAAGTYFIAIGVESGNQNVINKIGKNLELDAVRKAVKLIKKEKIILVAFFMIGHPFDTIKTMNDTINFAAEINPDYPIFSNVIAFPGTKLYNMVQKEGKFLITLQELERGYVRGGINFEIYDLKAKEAEKIFKQAYRRFYLRPRRILSLFLKIRTFSEIKYIINYSIIMMMNILKLNS